MKFIFIDIEDKMEKFLRFDIVATNQDGFGNVVQENDILTINIEHINYFVFNKIYVPAGYFVLADTDRNDKLIGQLLGISG